MAAYPSVLVMALVPLLGVDAFNHVTSPQIRISGMPSSSSRPTMHRPTSFQMCICINCTRVTNCLAYHFVEEQHAQPHINKKPTWEPRNGSPKIQVYIRPNADRKAEIELEKMRNEHESQTRQAEEADEGKGGTPLVGEIQYDLSGMTSYEYDVVQCEDFVEETDAWVRNMPEEIRLANPTFVPT